MPVKTHTLKNLVLHVHEQFGSNGWLMGTLLASSDKQRLPATLKPQAPSDPI